VVETKKDETTENAESSRINRELQPAAASPVRHGVNRPRWMTSRCAEIPR
jgi:hypothetical protein